MSGLGWALGLVLVCVSTAAGRTMEPSLESESESESESDEDGDELDDDEELEGAGGWTTGFAGTTVAGISSSESDEEDDEDDEDNETARRFRFLIRFLGAAPVGLVDGAVMGAWRLDKTVIKHIPSFLSFQTCGCGKDVQISNSTFTSSMPTNHIYFPTSEQLQSTLQRTGIRNLDLC